MTAIKVPTDKLSVEDTVETIGKALESVGIDPTTVWPSRIQLDHPGVEEVTFYADSEVKMEDSTTVKGKLTFVKVTQSIGASKAPLGMYTDGEETYLVRSWTLEKFIRNGNALAPPYEEWENDPECKLSYGMSWRPVGFEGKK